MTKGDIGSLIGTKGEAVGNGAFVAVFLVHQRHDLIEDVVLVLDVSANAFLRRDPAGIEALPRVTVDTEELEMALVDFIGKTVMHPKILILPEIAVPSGKNQHFGPGVTDDEKPHVAFDTMTEPTMVFEVHHYGPGGMASNDHCSCEVRRPGDSREAKLRYNNEKKRSFSASRSCSCEAWLS